MKKLVFGIALAAIALLIYTRPVAAKGGTTGGGVKLQLTYGSCPTDFFSDFENVTYPLVYGVDASGIDRKGVAMYIKMLGGSNILGIGGTPALVGVCLEPGWTVEAKDQSQATMFYNGEKAIDFKYVLGKTDIRYY